MEKPVEFDWAQARAFLAAAEAGSFSAASRRLGLTQPTVSRQIAALEADLGVTLFERAGRALVLTEAGIELLEHVRAMEAAANRVALAAAGQSQAIEGRVAISASDVVAALLLPPVLERIRREAPLVTLEIVASNALSDLGRREADIALRHVRPEQPELIARKLGDTTAHLYAAPAYLARHGRPAVPDDLADDVFIDFAGSDRFLTGLVALGLPLRRENFRLGSENGLVAWEMVRRGLGIGVMSRQVAEASGGVECLLPEIAIAVPTWLVAHRELRTSRRVRFVFDILAAELGGPARADQLPATSAT